jgi:AraC-like DNA-binding protein
MLGCCFPSFARHMAISYRKKDTIRCQRQRYPAGTVIPQHKHDYHQLLYAREGMLVVHSPVGRWVVPPTRAIWMPAGTLHSSRCVGDVEQRNVSVELDGDMDLLLPSSPSAVEVGPLLSQLMKAAEDVAYPYDEDSRDGRIMRLILDELRTLATLPLHLPQPVNGHLSAICAHMTAHPADNATLADWATHAGLHVKTIQRLFASELGMTFGQWRQRARLLHGLERLAQGSPVIDVALSLGYDSPSAFSAMFRKHFGLSPSTFFKPVSHANGSATSHA